MASLRSMSPHNIFKDVSESLRSSNEVTNITQSDDITVIYCDTSDIRKNNFVYISCGDLAGNYQVSKKYDDRFEIFYDGLYSIGTVETAPYFQWGNLKDSKIEIQRKDEYPLIFMILPDRYNVDVDDLNPIYIDDTFKFLIVNTFEDIPNKQETSKADYLYENYADEMVELSDKFALAVKSSKYINKDIELSRSVEIPIGVTIASNENGKTESLFTNNVVGCYLEIRVKIPKKYNNC